MASKAIKYQLQDLVRETGRPKTTLLRWEAEGKIPTALRDDNGWRYYTKEQFDQAVLYAGKQNPPISDLPIRASHPFREKQNGIILNSSWQGPHAFRRKALFAILILFVVLFPFLSKSATFQSQPTERFSQTLMLLSDKVAQRSLTLAAAASHVVSNIFKTSSEVVLFTFNGFREVAQNTTDLTLFITGMDRIEFPNVSVIEASLLLSQIKTPDEPKKLAAEVPEVNLSEPVLPVKEVIREIISNPDQSEVNRKLALLSSQFTSLDTRLNRAFSEIADIAAKPDSTERLNAHREMITLTQKIDELSEITVRNGLTLASGSLTISSGSLTISNDLTVSGSATFSNTSVGVSTAGYFTATSTTGTSTFAGKLGVGTTTPWGILSLEMSDTDPAFVVSDAGTSTPSFIINGRGRIGVATSTPSAGFDIYQHFRVTNNGSGVATRATSGRGLELEMDSSNTSIIRSYDRDAAVHIPMIINATAARFEQGSLGIGTTTPSGLLAVSAATTAPAFLLNQTSTGDLFTLQDSGTTRFIVKDGGNVGVGTSSPGAFSVSGGDVTGKLSIDVGSGDFTTPGVLVSGTGDNVALSLVNNAAGGKHWQFFSTGGSSSLGAGRLAFYDPAPGGGTRMVIDSSGNVGIGSTTPGGILSVSAGTAYPAFILNQTSTGDLLTLQDSGTTAFIVKDGGNVGIGTSSPGSKLVVNGAVEILGATNGNSVLQMGQNNAVDSVVNGYDNLFFNIDSNNDQAATYFAFGTNRSGTSGGTEIARLTETGTLGIGVTVPTSSTISPASGKFIDIGGTSFPAYILHSNLSAQESAILTDGNGLYFDVAGNSTASNNILVWRTSNTDSSYTPTERMRITSAGNVGIGETSPGSRLSVSGNATIGASYDTTAAPANGLLIEGATGLGTTSPGGFLSISVSTTSPAFLLNQTSTGDLLTLQDSGATVFRVADGAVASVLNSTGFGIGTTSPYAMLSVAGDIVGRTFAATSTTATSTFAGGFAVETSGLVYDFSSNRVGIGTASPRGKLDVALASGESVYFGNTGVQSPVFNSDDGWTFNMDANNNGTDGEFNIRTNATDFSSGTTLLQIEEAGTVLIGHATPAGRLGELFEIHTSGAYGGQAINTWSSTGLQAGIIDFNHSKSDTKGTHAAVASGDALGYITFRGSDGSAFQDGAQIIGNVDGTTGSSDMPGRLTFWTTPDGSATLAERMRITNAGLVGINDTSPDGLFDIDATGALDAFLVGTNARVGIGSSTPGALFSVSAATTVPAFLLNQTSTGDLFTLQDSGSTAFVVRDGGNIGVATSSPVGQLSIEMGTAGFPFWIGDAGTSTPALTVTGAGRVGIGTSSPLEKLTLTGGSFFQAGGDGVNNYTPTLVGSTETVYGIGNTVTGNPISVSGKYAYIGLDPGAVNIAGACSSSASTGCELHIYDVSTSTPAFVSGIDVGTSVYGLWISNNLLFVGTAASTTFPEFIIYDVSNPSSPKYLGGLEPGNSIYSIQVVGKYAYVGGPTGSLQIIDITDPKNPYVVGSVAANATINELYISGRYAYVVTTNAGGNEFQIIDISNPKNPTVLGGMDFGVQATAVFASGKYAYVGKNDGGITEDFIIYDVSNPSAPATTSSVTLATADQHVMSIFVAGRYAYLGTSLVPGNEFLVYDVGNPQNPVLVGGADSAGGAVPGIFISGRKAYVGATASGAAEFRVYDLTGAETQTLIAHSLEAGSLQVHQNLLAAGGIYSNSLNAGVGGIFSSGSLSVLASTTATSTNNTVASFLGGNVGIGTTTPFSTLQISSTTRTYFTITDAGAGSDLKHWTLGSMGGNFYLATSSDTYATSTTAALTINSSGLINAASGLSVSTTSPWGKLSVEMDTTDPSFVVSNTGSSSPAFIVGGVNQDGNVGIGTIPTATSKLSIAADDASVSGTTSLLRLVRTAPGTPANNTASAILFQFEDNVGQIENAAQIAGVAANTGHGGEEGHLTFSTASGNGTALTERMRIWSTQHISFGTTTKTRFIIDSPLDSNNSNGLDLTAVNTHAGSEHFGINLNLASRGVTGAEYRGLNVSVSGGSSNLGAALQAEGSATDAATEILRLTYNTSGTAADNIGAKINFYSEDTNGSTELAGSIAGIMTNAGHGAEAGGLSFGTRAGEMMRLNEAGNLGVGTTSIGAKLHLTKTTAADTDLRFESQTYNWIMGIDNSDAGKFKISSSTALGTNDRLTIDGRGFVGIGSNAPSKLLSISGSPASATDPDSFVLIDSADINRAPALEARTGTVRNVFAALGAGTGNSGAIGTYSDHALSIRTASTSRIFVASDGLVGIGNSAPSALLHVSSTTPGMNLATFGSVVVNKDSYLGIGSSTPGMPVSILGSQPDSSGYNPYVYVVGTDPNRNVSIKTQVDTVEALLGVVGGSTDIGFVGTQSAHNFQIYANNTALLTAAASGRSGFGTTSPGAILSVSAATTVPAFLLNQTSTGDLLTLQDSGTTAFIVKDGGNVGIGTSSPGAALSVVGNTSGLPALLVNNLNAGGDLATFQDFGTTMLKLTRAGYLGLSTTTPAAMLAVSQGNNAPGFILNQTGTGVPFTINVNASEIFKIMQSDGSVAINGSSTPVGLLSIQNTGVSKPGIIIQNTSGGAPIVVNVNAAEIFKVTQAGNVTLDGNLGAGSSTPNWKLSVAGDAVIWNGGTQADLKAYNGAICSDNNGTTKCQAALTAGTVYGDTSSFGASDVAENYPVFDESIEAGDIVAIGTAKVSAQSKDKEALRGKMTESEFNELSSSALLDSAALVKADASNKARVIGIVSTAPGVLLGDTTGMTLNTETRPVALVGRVPLKVSSEGGSIEIGDRITLSSIPGVGMKATSSGLTIGLVLESFDEANALSRTLPDGTLVKTGFVLVFVNLAQADLDNGITQVAQGETNAWSVDQSTGKVNVNFYGDVDLHGNTLLGVKEIVSQNGLWKIDENGRMTIKHIEADEIKTNKLIVGSETQPSGITVYDKNGKAGCVSVDDVDSGQIKLAAGICNILPLSASSEISLEPESTTATTTETTTEATTRENQEVASGASSASSETSPAISSSSSETASSTPDSTQQ